MPGPKFVEGVTDALVVGYGASERVPCEVDGKGPDKFGFCGVEDGCHLGMGKACKVRFQHKGKTLTGCSKSQTPSADNRLCKDVR